MRVSNLILFGGKMRNMVWETAFQKTLRNCSKEVRGKVSMYITLGKGVQSRMHCNRGWPLVTRSRCHCQ